MADGKPPSLSKAWEGSAIILSRFRTGISWLQFPIFGNTAPTPANPKKKPDPHGPSTRGLELNAEVLRIMLDYHPSSS